MRHGGHRAHGGDPSRVGRRARGFRSTTEGRPSTMRVGGARGARGGDGGRAGRGRGGRRDKMRGSRGGGRAGVSQTGPRRAYARRARARREADGDAKREAADRERTPARDPRLTSALRPARTPFGNLLSVFQPTPRKRDAGTTGTTAPRRLLRGGARPVVVVDENAFAVDGDVARRDTDTTRVEFLSAARAKLAETMECALSPGFRRVRSRGRDAAAEDVDVVGANLAVAAKAMGVTLVGHSVSFDPGGKSTTFGRADAPACERASERASGRGGEGGVAGDGGGDDADGARRERGENKRAKRARGGDDSENGIEMRDLGTKGGAAPRSPLGPIGRVRAVDARARARGVTSSSKDGKRGGRAVVRTGPMATWGSPEWRASGGGFEYASPVRGGGFGSPLATRSPLARMR